MSAAGDDFQAVLRSAQAGDEVAFTQLFRSVQPQLLRYLSVLGPANVEDVAAETWVGVVRGLRDFRGDEPGWRAWVFTIAHARLRDAQRRAGRVPVPVDTEDLLDAEAAPVDVAGEVDEALTTQAALRLVAGLPRDQAAAVLLRHVVGLDVPQTAAVLGKRSGAVRVATHRGLKNLAKVVDRPARATAPAPAQAGDPRLAEPGNAHPFPSDY